MERFKYYMDFGSGYVEVNPFNNQGVWINEIDINPAIKRIKLEGSLTFMGSEYDDIITFRDDPNNYIDFKLEQLDGTWQTIFEGNIDLREAWDENQKFIVLNKFNNQDDYYDGILSNAGTKYNYSDFTSGKYRIVTPTETSVTIDAALVAGTGLTPAQYIAAYDVNGFLVVAGFPDPRWVYFLFRSTNPDGSHNFETMSFTYAVNPNYGYTEIRLLRSNVYDAYWVKLPPGVGTTENLVTTVAYAPQRFPDVIDAALANVATGLTFTEGTAIIYTDAATNNFNFSNYLLDESSSVVAERLQGSEISFQFLTDLMQEAFNLFWFLDGTALRFKHASDLTTTGSLDLSDETVDLKQLSYSDVLGNSTIPDVESFFTNDVEGEWDNSNVWGIVEIFYRSSKTTLSNHEKVEHKINVSTNVPYMMAGKANSDKNNYTLLEATDNSSTPRVIYDSGSGEYNSRLGVPGLFFHLNKYRWDDEADLATGLKFGWIPLLDIESRPKKTMAIIDYHVDLLTDYDMDKEIITSAGTGITKRISQRLDSDHAQIEVVI